MRKVSITASLLLLAAALIGNVILYGKYESARDSLRVAEKEISALTGKVDQLNQAKAASENRIRETAERLETLKKVASELETKDALVKDLRALGTEAESQAATLRQDAAKGVAEIEGLRGRLSDLEKVSRDKDGSLADLGQKLQKSVRESEANGNTIALLRDELSSKDGLITKLEGRLADLTRGDARLKTKLSEIETAHDTMISRLRNQIQNKEVTISELREKLSITFVDRVLFDFGRATITPEGRGILAKVGAVLKGVKSKTVRVIGHTDDRPIAAEYRYRFPSNWELSSARAASVVRFFQQEAGLRPKDMEAVGRSFYEPVASNATQEGRALNRRVIIIIAPGAE